MATVKIAVNFST